MIVYRPVWARCGILYRWILRDVILGNIEAIERHKGKTPNWTNSPVKAAGCDVYKLGDIADDETYVLRPSKNTPDPVGLTIPRKELTEYKSWWFAMDDPSAPSLYVLFPAENDIPQLRGGDGLPVGDLYVFGESLPLREDRGLYYVNPGAQFLRWFQRDTEPVTVRIFTDGRNLVYKPTYHASPLLSTRYGISQRPE
jgi:hypothetical protein